MLFHISRRTLIKAGAALPAGWFFTGPASSSHASPAKGLKADVIIAGGGVGGCAAALSACRLEKKVVLIEPTAWIGGQLTSQAVPPDENPWIETFGGTASYRNFRTRVRDYYRRNYPLTAEAHALAELNPGNGSVSRLCHEPRVALAVLQEMLAPYMSNGLLAILLHHRPLKAETNGNRIQSLLVRNELTGNEMTLEAPFFLDATEMGDLLPLAGVEYVTGTESKKETGELHAPEQADPQNMQAFTACFAMEYREGEDHTLDRPAEYDFWRSYIPTLDPPWAGPLLSLTTTHPITLEKRPMQFDPTVEKTDGPNLWRYRRIIDRKNYAQPSRFADVSLVNWPQNDYWLGNLYEVPEEEAHSHLQRAKQLSLSLLYWLQTEAPRRDGGTGWKGLRLRGDLVGTEDGLAMHPYIRESRRIRAEYTVLEQYVGKQARAECFGVSQEGISAEVFNDSAGIGYYRIDLHPGSGGKNYIDVESLPFQIPLGALIPIRVENLLPAAKNLGVTHITNGCYRLHPVEWNIGESAGALAAWCLQHNWTPREVRNDPSRLAQFQSYLKDTGIPLEWPPEARVR